MNGDLVKRWSTSAPVAIAFYGMNQKEERMIKIETVAKLIVSGEEDLRALQEQLRNTTSVNYSRNKILDMLNEVLSEV